MIVYIHRAIGLLGAAVICLCCDGQDLPEIRYRTERLLIGTDFEEPVCAGSLAALERHARFLETVLEEEIDEPIALYWFEDSSSTGCGSGASGCYDIYDEAVKTTWYSAFHELAHATSHRWSHPDALFSEGFAEVFSGIRTEFGPGLPSDNLGAKPNQVRHGTAAHFTRWLYEQYGMDRLMALFSMSAWARGSPMRTQEAFRKVYLFSMDTADELYFETAPESYPGLTFCDLEVLQWSGELWRHGIELSCDAQHTRGYRDMSRIVGFEIQSPGYYVFEIEEPGEAYITTCNTEVVHKGQTGQLALLPVGQERTAGAYLLGNPISFGAPQELALGAGLYRLVVTVPGVAPTTVRAQLTRQIGTVPVTPVY